MPKVFTYPESWWQFNFITTYLSIIYDRLDVIYCGEEDDVCIIQYKGEERRYRRLHVLEFDSDRKRMSVIVQCPDDTIWLLCKGAESSILPRCAVGAKAETEEHIKDYAMVFRLTIIDSITTFNSLFSTLVGIENASDCVSIVVCRVLRRNQSTP